MWYMQRRAVHWCWLVGVVALLATAALPAAACGCGAYLPREGTAHVAQERALIRWENGTEDIVMALSVEGQSQEAAWILPVPTRATVQLADPRLFDTLEELTKPLVRVERVWWDLGGGGGGGPAGTAAVTVLDRQALGPFDVSTLAARDAQALADWLDGNGYQFPARLARVLHPYVDQGWEYVAVRLVPPAAGQPLTGHLDPLWVTFASDTIVYPMRPTALARSSVPVFLYVLAPHRVDHPSALADKGVDNLPGSSNVTYAQWIEPSALVPESPLAPFVDRTLFLTKFAMVVHTPARIADDFTFPFAREDAPYHQVDVRYEVVRWGPWLWLGFGVAAALYVVYVMYGRFVVGRIPRS
jgi:hypothetical protein